MTVRDLIRVLLDAPMDMEVRYAICPEDEADEVVGIKFTGVTYGRKAVMLLSREWLASASPSRSDRKE